MPSNHLSFKLVGSRPGKEGWKMQLGRHRLLRLDAGRAIVEGEEEEACEVCSCSLSDIWTHETCWDIESGQAGELTIVWSLLPSMYQLTVAGKCQLQLPLPLLLPLPMLRTRHVLRRYVPRYVPDTICSLSHVKMNACSSGITTRDMVESDPPVDVPC